MQAPCRSRPSLTIRQCKDPTPGRIRPSGPISIADCVIAGQIGPRSILPSLRRVVSLDSSFLERERGVRRSRRKPSDPVCPCSSCDASPTSGHKHQGRADNNLTSAGGQRACVKNRLDCAWCVQRARVVRLPTDFVAKGWWDPLVSVTENDLGSSLFDGNDQT